MASSRENDAIPELDSDRPTTEVGSEGGSPGDVELDRDIEVGRGSEAAETWQSENPEVHEVYRDDAGIGRRSPAGNARP